MKFGGGVSAALTVAEQAAESGAGNGTEKWRGRVRIAVAGAFLLGSSLHFIATETEMRLIPGWIPWHRELVYLSGVAEILGAVALLVPRTRRAAAWGLALLLVAVFPANINQTVTHISMGGFMDSRFYHWTRWPLQPIFIAVVLWSGGMWRNGESGEAAKSFLR